MTTRYDALCDAQAQNGYDALCDAAAGPVASGASFPPSFTGGNDASRAMRPISGVGNDAVCDAGNDAERVRRFPTRNDARYDAPRANPHTPDGRRADAEYVLHRLNEAGTVLLSLPDTGYSTRLRGGGLEWVRDAAAGYGLGQARIRPPVPLAAAIDRMDAAWVWLGLIPADRFVLRRVVGARSLVSPMTGRHVLSWRRIGDAVGADHKAVQRWHAQGVDMIVAGLNGGGGMSRTLRPQPLQKG